MTTNLWAYPIIVIAEEDKPRKKVNVESTIANLVSLGAIPDQEQQSLEKSVFYQDPTPPTVDGVAEEDKPRKKVRES